MKKIILIVTLGVLSTALYAQSKGNSYVSATVGFEFGNQENKVSVGSFSESETQPLASTFVIGTEYGYFIEDNFKLGLGLCLPITSSPVGKDDDEWLKSKTVGFGINPNVAYYARVNDNFYYVPELGVNFEFGDYEQEISLRESYNTDYKGWAVYLSILSFEFKVSKSFALGLNMGTLGYSSLSMKDDETDTTIDISSFKCDFNSADIHARFYF